MRYLLLLLGVGALAALDADRDPTVPAAATSWDPPTAADTGSVAVATSGRR